MIPKIIKHLNNSTLVIYNCLDLASNLISLSSIYISMKESNIKIQVIENNSSSIFLSIIADHFFIKGYCILLKMS